LLFVSNSKSVMGQNKIRIQFNRFAQLVDTFIVFSCAEQHPPFGHVNRQRERI